MPCDRFVVESRCAFTPIFRCSLSLLYSIQTSVHLQSLVHIRRILTLRDSHLDDESNFPYPMGRIQLLVLRLGCQLLYQDPGAVRIDERVSFSNVITIRMHGLIS